MKHALAAAISAALIAALVAVSSVGATPPGKDGSIVFDVYNPRADAGDLYAAALGGGALHRLVATKADETGGSWSPDGKSLAFTRILPGRGHAAIYLADANGGNVRKLVGGDRWYMNPTWSPDGTRIAFYSKLDFPRPSAGKQPPPSEIYTIGVDGKGLRRLTHDHALDWDPTWSPDGTTLAFFSDRDAKPGPSLNIYLIGADGSNLRRAPGSGVAANGIRASRPTARRSSTRRRHATATRATSGWSDPADTTRARSSLVRAGRPTRSGRRKPMRSRSRAIGKHEANVIGRTRSSSSGSWTCETSTSSA